MVPPSQPIKRALSYEGAGAPRITRPHTAAKHAPTHYFAAVGSIATVAKPRNGYRDRNATTAPRFLFALIACAVLLAYPYPSFAKGLVFITHGWMGNGRDGWVNDLFRAICQEVNASDKPDTGTGRKCESSNWDVETYDWEEQAKTGWSRPYDAYVNAISVGMDVASTLGTKVIDEPTYNRIHFIAHSAGSQVIQTATEQIKAQSTIKGLNVYIHNTFLDAFDPTGGFLLDPTKSSSILGKGADYAEHYVDTRPLGAFSEVLGVGSTRTWLPYAQTFDVTYYSSYYSFGTCFPEIPIVYDICVHRWPALWYITTVGNNPQHTDGSGFPKSPVNWVTREETIDEETLARWARFSETQRLAFLDDVAKGLDPVSEQRGPPLVTGSDFPGTLPDLLINTLTVKNAAKSAVTRLHIQEAGYCGTQIKNTGLAKSATFQTRCYLSNGYKLDTNPDDLGKEDTASLGKGLTVTKHEDFNAPRYPGIYNIVACADSGKQVKEVKEKNNCSSEKTFEVWSTTNLTVSGLGIGGGRTSLDPHEPYSVNTTITNTGENIGRTIMIGYYLNEILIGTDRIKRENLLGGQNKVETLESATAPASPGSYTLKTCVDYDNRVAETNENDNCAVLTIAVKGRKGGMSLPTLIEILSD